MRNGNDVRTRYATEMYMSATGFVDLKSVIDHIGNKAKIVEVEKGEPCAWCGRDDLSVGYTIVNSALSKKFGDHMSLSDQSGHLCPYCTAIVRADLRETTGVVVWEDETGNCFYKVVRGDKNPLHGRDENTIKKSDLELYLLSPPGRYFAIALNRSFFAKANGAHFLPGAMVCAAKESYILTSVESKRDLVSMDIAFLMDFWDKKHQSEQLLAANKKSRKRLFVGPWAFDLLDDYLNSFGFGNVAQTSGLKDPWNDLPASLRHMVVFKPIWPQIRSDRAALRVLYSVKKAA